MLRIQREMKRNASTKHFVPARRARPPRFFRIPHSLELDVPTLSWHLNISAPPESPLAIHQRRPEVRGTRSETTPVPTAAGGGGALAPIRIVERDAAPLAPSIPPSSVVGAADAAASADAIDGHVSAAAGARRGEGRDHERSHAR